MKKWQKGIAALLTALAVSLSASAPVLAAEGADVSGAPIRFADGWVQQEDGSWRYYRDGESAVGWLQLDGTWYYLDADGMMKTGWLQLGDTWYYLKDWGGMATGWQQVGGTWYYFRDWGGMATGWLQLGDTWYYLHPSGAMATGTHVIDGRSYTFSSSGAWTGTSSAVSGLQALLNSAALKPQATVSSRLNALVQDFIGAHLSDSMDTYTRVRTVFDYMIDNYVYDNSVMNLTDPELVELYFSGGMNEIMAIWILESGRGVCDNYSAAFAAILRAIGLDCRVVTGVAYTTSGSGSGHAWTVVNIGGTEYIFDPQIEQNIAQRDGVVHYYRFGVTYDSIPGRYAVSGYQDFL